MHGTNVKKKAIGLVMKKIKNLDTP